MATTTNGGVTAHDMSGGVEARATNGRLDVAVINNENAKLVLLYQRVPGEASGKNARRAVVRNRWEPVIEDSRFEKVSLPADQRHFAMVAGDFDGDGRPDLALTGAEDALTVRFQAADGTLLGIAFAQ